MKYAMDPRCHLRRKLLSSLGAGALISARPSFAQLQSGVRRIGILFLLSRQSALETGRYSAFLDGKRELGYVEGKNLLIKRRYADGRPKRLHGLASELINLKPEIIVTAGTTATRRSWRR